jgi:hypothetical protein
MKKRRSRSQDGGGATPQDHTPLKAGCDKKKKPNQKGSNGIIKPKNKLEGI